MEGNWFLIMCSWDWNADKDALEKFQWVYTYLNLYNTPAEWKKVHKDDPRRAMDFRSLKALNLIGQRKFVIIIQTSSNNVLQKISSEITLGTAIKVEIFPATYVHEFKDINVKRLPGVKGEGLN